MKNTEKQCLHDFAHWLRETGQEGEWEAENICDMLRRVVAHTGSKVIAMSDMPGYSRFCATKLVKQDLLSDFPGEYDDICAALEKFVAYADQKSGMKVNTRWSAQDSLFSDTKPTESPRSAPLPNTQEGAVKKPLTFEQKIGLSGRILQSIVSYMAHPDITTASAAEGVLEKLETKIKESLARGRRTKAELPRTSSEEEPVLPVPARRFRKLQEKIVAAFTEKDPERKICFIGDIQIDDAEYALLLEYTRFQLKNHAINAPGMKNSPLVAVALVQIGIRFYDGSYWIHAEKELHTRLQGLSQRFLNETFQNTVQVYGLPILHEKYIVQNILFHGVVSNYYAKGLFELLLQYYQRDLERNLARNTPERMKMLLGALKKTQAEEEGKETDLVSRWISGTSKAYKLNKHTLAAITEFPEVSGPRLQKYVAWIDTAFWNHELPQGTGTRLTECFKTWAKTTQEFQDGYRTLPSAQKGPKKKYFQKPYLHLDRESNSLEIRLPQQILRPALGGGTVTWKITGEGFSDVCMCDTYEVFGGYETMAGSLPIPQRLGLLAIECVLCREEAVLSRFTLPAVSARFFDEDGDQANSLQAGVYSSITQPGEELRSAALLDNEALAEVHRWDFEFEDGDVVVLPDMGSLCVGGNYKEGLLQRGRVPYTACEKVSSSLLPVYQCAPEILLLVEEEKIDGSALYVNGKRYRLGECRFDRVRVAQLNKKSGVVLSTGQFPEIADHAVNYVALELPGATFARTPFAFALCEGLQVEFEDAPYIFAERGTIAFSPCTPVAPAEGQSYEKSPEGNSFNFDLTAQNGQLHFVLAASRLPIVVDIPALSWSKDQEHWMLTPMGDIWNKDFPYMLYIRGSFREVRFDFGIDADAMGSGAAESSLIFKKNAQSGIFVCDLTRVRSWITRDKACYPVRLLLDKKAFSFGAIYTQSILVPDKLEMVADFLKDQLILNCEIIGQNKEYYADIQFKKTGELLAEKEPFDGKRLTLSCQIPNGEYEVTVYENDDEDFFDDTYYALGSYSCTLIDKNNLSGKQIRLKYVSRWLHGSFRLPIDGGVRVHDLKRMSPTVYQAELVDSQGKKQYQVQITLPGTEDMGRFFLRYWDDQYKEYYEFDYDRTQHSLLTEREEQAGLPYNKRYRRYTTLFDDQDTFVGVFEDESPTDGGTKEEV